MKQRERKQAVAVSVVAHLVAAVFLLLGEKELAAAQLDMSELLSRCGEEMDEHTFEALRQTVLLNFEDCAPYFLALASQAQKAAEERRASEAQAGESPQAIELPGRPEPKQLAQDNEFTALLDRVNGIGTKGVLS